MKKIPYLLFSLIAMLAVNACQPPEQRIRQEAKPAPVAAVPKPVAVNPASTTPNTVILQEPEKKEDFAPATSINGANKNGAKKEVTPDGNYAPPTQLGQASESPTIKVALLIPMSGESELLGKSLLDAAVLAIYDKYSSLPNRDTTAKVELLPKDTGDTIETAEKVTQDALAEGAEIILGPLFSKQVSAVSAIAKSKKIPVITFSNNVGVAGDGVYLFGFIPEQQVSRIVLYALQDKGRNISALVPSNPYGATIVKQLSTEVRKTGNRAHPIEYYSEDISALDSNVGRLARFFQDDPNKNQALFIAEGGDRLKVISDTLFANGINSGNIQLLGTGLWDDPALLKLPNMYGAIFASSPPEKYAEFEKHFFANYSYKPERRASLSYDLVALVINLALASKGNGFPKAIITDNVGFNGPANGIFRFHEDGTIERGLSVLKITGTGFKTIDAAPVSFNQ